jgi:parvulin-like peptidyl-prolyl isomerase
VGRGGDLGWVREDQLVPALRNASTTLSENAISEPVRSPEAWHIVKLLGTKPLSVLPLDQVREQLVQALRQTMAQQLARAYVDDMLRQEPSSSTRSIWLIRSARHADAGNPLVLFPPTPCAR